MTRTEFRWINKSFYVSRQWRSISIKNHNVMSYCSVGTIRCSAGMWACHSVGIDYIERSLKIRLHLRHTLLDDEVRKSLYPLMCSKGDIGGPVPYSVVTRKLYHTKG